MSAREKWLPADIHRDRLEAWLGEPMVKFAKRCEHAARMSWRQARIDPERRDYFLRASRRLSEFGQALREFDKESK